MRVAASYASYNRSNRSSTLASTTPTGGTCPRWSASRVAPGVTEPSRALPTFRPSPRTMRSRSVWPARDVASARMPAIFIPPTRTSLGSLIVAATQKS
ncbi:MAG: hypothetical protein HY815_14125 [Candidatus Riflebacteria bacterium]|nr:hypothetical protein [Candidatus Riflebacteria bacterium]